MQTRIFVRPLVAALCFAAAVTTLLAPETNAQTAYTVTDLGTLGGPSSTALSINSRGQVVGYSTTAPGGYNQGFVWTPATPNGTTGSMRTLALLKGYYWAQARAINDSGQIAGVSGGNWNAILWSADGTPNLLGYLTKNPTTSWAEAINNSGEVAGGALDAAGHLAPFLWKPTSPNGAKGKMVQIGSVSLGVGNENGNTHHINSYGQVNYAISGFEVLWTPSLANGTTGSMTTLPLSPSTQAGINDYGQVAGFDEVGGSLWTPNAPNGLTGSAASIASGGADSINASGQVAGIDAAGHLYLWTPFVPNGTAGTVVDLSTLPMYDESGNPAANWTFSTAPGLNVYGQITGTGTHNGVTRAYLLAPRP